MGAAVEDVHHRNRKHVGVRSSEVPEWREIGGQCCRAGHRQRDSKNRVCPEAGLVRRSIQIDHGLVDQSLIGGIHADDLGTDLILDCNAGLENALAAVSFIAITKLNGFVCTC